MKFLPRLLLGSFNVPFVVAVILMNNAMAFTTKGDLILQDGKCEPSHMRVDSIESWLNNDSVRIYDIKTSQINIVGFSEKGATDIYFSEQSNSDLTTWLADTIAGDQSLLSEERNDIELSFLNAVGDESDDFLAEFSDVFKSLDPNTNTETSIQDTETVRKPLLGTTLIIGAGLLGITAIRRRCIQR